MKISNPTARIGEEIACKFLKNQGYKIIDRNFRKVYGELDIIAIKNDTLVFIEVKTRRNKQFGEPQEQITHHKVRSLIRTAQFYKSLNPKTPDQMRIDAISILLDEKGSTINHIENIT